MSNRVQNTKRNILFSYILMLIQIVFQFVSKTVIVYSLGIDYLGLSSLFISILMVLNVADLGFTPSVMFFLYKPLAENNVQEVNKLLNYLKKIYLGVGVATALMGIMVMPFVPKLIKGDVPANINLFFLYSLYLLNNALGYFLFAHYSVLLTALQRMDIIKIVQSIVSCIQFALQLGVLLVFHNYYFFVIIMIIGTMCSNVLIALFAKEKYAQFKCEGELDEHIRSGIITKVKALLIGNISSITYTTLDSIFISSLIGLVAVGIYANYITVYNAIYNVFMIIRMAMQASVGDSVASDSISKNYEDMKLWQFLFSTIGIWSFACMICLYQPFMCLWMGEGMLLPMVDVILIASWLLVGAVQNAFYLYLSGAGLWHEMRWTYIFSSIFNIILNYFLGRTFGAGGIILASLVSCLVSGTFIQCHLVFKHYFKMKAWSYIIKQFGYFSVALITGGVSYGLCSFIQGYGIKALLYRLIICSLVSILFIFSLYGKTPYFRTSMDIVSGFINNRKKRG